MEEKARRTRTNKDQKCVEKEESEIVKPCSCEEPMRSHQRQTPAMYRINPDPRLTSLPA